MRKHGFNERPLYKHRPPEQTALRRRWSNLAKFRDRPINSCRTEIGDIGEATADIKRLTTSAPMPSRSQSSPLCRSMGGKHVMITVDQGACKSIRSDVRA